MDEDRILPTTGSPEGLELAESYLVHGNASGVSEELGIPMEIVAKELQKPEIRTYINQVFLESGFRNRTKFFGLLDQMINQKIMEAEETGMVTDEDLLTVLEKVHKMKMAEMQMEIKMMEVQAKLNGANKPVQQTNIQNNFGGSEGMSSLMGQLLGNNND